MRVFCECGDPATIDLVGKILSVNLWFADGETYVVLPAEDYDVCRGCHEAARFAELAADGNRHTTGRQWVRALIVGAAAKVIDLRIRGLAAQATA